MQQATCQALFSLPFWVSGAGMLKESTARLQVCPALFLFLSRGLRWAEGAATVEEMAE